MLFRRKEKGWFGEKKRHRLAAKGIKTGRKDIFKRTTNVDYYNDILKNPDKIRTEEGESVFIKYMRPKKYLRESKKMQKGQGFKPEKPEKGLIEIYKNRVESGERMPLPYLDYTKKKEDGPSKALVAKQMKTRKIPVLVIRKKEKKQQIVHQGW